MGNREIYGEQKSAFIGKICSMFKPTNGGGKSGDAQETMPNTPKDILYKKPRSQRIYFHNSGF